MPQAFMRSLLSMPLVEALLLEASTLLHVVARRASNQVCDLLAQALWGPQILEHYCIGACSCAVRCHCDSGWLAKLSTKLSIN